MEIALQDFVAAAAAQAHPLVIDAGAGEARFRGFFDRSRYVAVDSGIGDQGWNYSRLDVRADVGSLPFRGGTADAVLHTQVLEHVPDPGQVLAELARVLKPGGVLYLTAPQGWSEHQQPHDYYRFTRFSLARLLAGAGFTDWRIEPMGGYFHYLGHRLTQAPKVVFGGLEGWRRIAALPLELCAVGLCCVVLPIACTLLDPLDRSREFTLCYRVRATKGRPPEETGLPGAAEEGCHAGPC